MMDIPIVSIAFKPDELVELIRILRDEVNAAFSIKQYDRANMLANILQKLGDDITSL